MENFESARGVFSELGECDAASRVPGKKVTREVVYFVVDDNVYGVICDCCRVSLFGDGFFNFSPGEFANADFLSGGD